MKKIIYTILLITSFFILYSSFSIPVSAHLIGQPPFFKINGEYTPYYPVPTTSIPEFPLPQDYSPKTFLVGEMINFEIDQTQLPAPKEIVEKTKFAWDLGDGVKVTGMSHPHAYQKPGSYIIHITADAGDGIPPQLLQSTLINIIPNKDYQLPKSVISVNNWQSRDPLTDALTAKFDQEFKFDGSQSTEGSSKIVEYFWDFGDTEDGSGTMISHRYTINPYTVFPVLRIKTADGFIADSFIQIKDSQGLTNNPGAVIKNTLSDNPITRQPNILRYLLVGVGIIVVIYIISFIVIKLKRRK